MTFQEWLALHTRPLIGADDDPAKTDPKDDDDDPAKTDPKDDPSKQDPSKGGNDDDPKDDDDDDPVAKETERLRKENAKYKREARQREDKEKQEEKDKKAAEGKHEQLAKEAQEEKEEEEKKRKAAEYELEQTKREIRTRDAATALNFRDPGDAILFLNEDDTESPESVSRALKKLADKKPYLLNDRPRSGRGGSGGGKGGDGGLTREDIESMSSDEIAARMPDVKKALQQQQPKRTGS